MWLWKRKKENWDRIKVRVRKRMLCGSRDE